MLKHVHVHVHVGSNSISTKMILNNLFGIGLQDLQEDAERNLLAIEQMMSQFDGSNK